jgi:hypothetical protein
MPLFCYLLEAARLSLKLPHYTTRMTILPKCAPEAMCL